MVDFFSEMRSKVSNMFNKDDSDIMSDAEKEYVELDTESGEQPKGKVIIRPFTIEDFADIKNILDCMREGNTIALINIRPLKEKDVIELKRAINKLKKTTDAIEGDIAGFGEDYIVVTPSFAKVHRAGGVKKQAAPADDSEEI